jgi:hypothetical protein
MEGNNDPPTTQTSGDIGVDRIMELGAGPMENDASFNTSDPENCGTGTICYDLVPSYLVPSDHLISAFQQGHQAFPLVKLKDNLTNAFGNVYCCFPFTHGPHLPGPYICPVPDLHLHMTLIDHCYAAPSSNNHLAINIGRYHFYNKVSQ